MAQQVTTRTISLIVSFVLLAACAQAAPAPSPAELGAPSIEVVADGLPVLNGFGFGPDGRLYAPTGGVEALLGSTGGLIAIDAATGSTEVIPLQFDELGRTGLAFAVGVDVGPDGTVYIAQGVDPALYAVDPSTGHATLVGTSPEAAADNVLVLSDGRILLSGFVALRSSAGCDGVE